MQSTRYSCQIEYSRQFTKNTQISNFMNIRPVGAEMFDAEERTDGRTDGRDETNSRFTQFCEKRLKTCASEMGCFHLAFWNN